MYGHMKVKLLEKYVVDKDAICNDDETYSHKSYSCTVTINICN